LGVAVSGGGDSVALLVLLHRAGFRLLAATVDHGLRPESEAEAQGVAVLCERLGIPHQVLRWQKPSQSGNLQMAAREARISLLSGWAKAHGLGHIALGHTLDDQGETVLMRLARGSGVDGLAGMAVKRCKGGLCWHRPLLEVGREALRDFLREEGVVWVEDPSNEDMGYHRVKARRALGILESLGLDAARLAQTAKHMRRAREALEDMTIRLARECVSITVAGELRLGDLSSASREVQLRLLAGALQWVSSAPYRPRFAALEALLDFGLSGKKTGRTLHGCALRFTDHGIVINREPAATPACGPVVSLWDGRWEISEMPEKTAQIRALGEDGLSCIPDWRESGHSRAALLPSPSFWQGSKLIAAPLAGFGDFGGVKLALDQKGFYEALMTH